MVVGVRVGGGVGVWGFENFCVLRRQCGAMPGHTGQRKLSRYGRDAVTPGSIAAWCDRGRPLTVQARGDVLLSVLFLFITFSFLTFFSLFLFLFLDLFCSFIYLKVIFVFLSCPSLSIYITSHQVPCFFLTVGSYCLFANVLPYCIFRGLCPRILPLSLQYGKPLCLVQCLRVMAVGVLYCFDVIKLVFLHIKVVLG